MKDTLTIFASVVTVVFASIALEDRDPCDGHEGSPGCRERETAGDRWSRDQQRIVRTDGTTGVMEPKIVDANVRVQESHTNDVPAESAVEILNQVKFPTAPLAMMEIDEYGNIILPVHADALVTHDGVGTPEIAGMDIRGSRCARSVEYAMRHTDGAFTVVCLPREFGLLERMNGRPAPAEGEHLED